jgi:phage shock protein C
MSEQEPTEVTPPAEATPPPSGAAQPPPEPEAAPGAGPEPEPKPELESELESTAAPEATTAVTAPGSRRLHRSRDDRVIAGVCGGLGEYFGVDAVLVRIAALVLLFAGGAGALLYLIGWVAMPEESETEAVGATTGAAPVSPPAERTSGAVALGILFVLLGAFFLVDEIWSDFLAWKYIWPIVLIAVGAAVLVRARR